MAANYWKVVRRPTATSRERVIDVVTFDDASLDSIKAAWEMAILKRGFTGACKVVAGNRVPLSGPWSECPVTYESGLSQEWVP